MTIRQISIVEPIRIEGVIPWSVKPLFAVLAIFPGFVCSLAAFLCLGLRTGTKGRYNLFLLLFAGICMACGVWCTHFIATSSLVLYGGVERAFCYSALPLVGSLLIPITSFPCAFVLLSIRETVEVWQVLVAAPFGAASIVLMHYVGQWAISNYINHFLPGYILAAVFSAIITSTGALTLYYCSKTTWSDNFWKKSLYSVTMDIGVNLMHWLAMTGTRYTLPAPGESHCPIAKDVAVWIAFGISGLICSVPIACWALWDRTQKTNLRGVKQVMLGLAYFSPDGNLLTSATTNTIPSKKVADSYQSTGDDFTEDSSLFAWFYRLSGHWSIVVDLIHLMREDVGLEEARNVRENGKYDPKLEISPEFRFKERLCLAVHDLCCLIDRPLASMGILFPEIAVTGTNFNRPRVFRSRRSSMQMFPASTPSAQEDAIIGARGKMLFLVKRLDQSEVRHFRALGYQFAPADFTMENTAQSLHITRRSMQALLERLKKCPAVATVLEPTVYISVFLMRASRGNQPKVLVPKDATDFLPTIKVQGVDQLEDSNRFLLQKFDRERPWDIMAALDNQKTQDAPVSVFDDAFLEALQSLRVRLGSHSFDNLQLFATVQSIPSSGPVGPDGVGPQAQLIMFGGIQNATDPNPNCELDVFMPLSLLRSAQHAYRGVDDDQDFAQQTKSEICAVLNDIGRDSVGTDSLDNFQPSTDSSFALRRCLKPRQELTLATQHREAYTAPASGAISRPMDTSRSIVDDMLEEITVEHRRKSRQRFHHLTGFRNAWEDRR